MPPRFGLGNLSAVIGPKRFCEESVTGRGCGGGRTAADGDSARIVSAERASAPIVSAASDATPALPPADASAAPAQARKSRRLMSTALLCAESTYFFVRLRDEVDRRREVLPLDRLRLPLLLRERLRAGLRDVAPERLAVLPVLPASPARAP
jgi:hypothetical protein